MFYAKKIFIVHMILNLHIGHVSVHMCFIIVRHVQT